TTDIEHFRSARHIEGAERDATVQAHPLEQDVSKALELRDEDVVPEPGELVVRDGGGVIHEQSPGEAMSATRGLRTPSVTGAARRSRRGLRAVLIDRCALLSVVCGLGLRLPCFANAAWSASPRRLA